MMNSRDLKELLPVVRAKVDAFLASAKKEGIDLLVTSTYRDAESQNALYAQGRTTPGKIVTNAKAGQSWHNHRCAIDVVPIVNGKAVWNDAAMWTKVGAIGKAAGLEWSGEWTGKMKETAHFQYTGGKTLAQLQSGEKVV